MPPSKTKKRTRNEVLDDEFNELRSNSYLEDVFKYLNGLAEECNMQNQKKESQKLSFFSMDMAIKLHNNPCKDELLQQTLCAVDCVSECNLLGWGCSIDIAVIACKWALEDVFQKLHELDALDEAVREEYNFVSLAVEKIECGPPAAKFVEFLAQKRFDLGSQFRHKNAAGNYPCHLAAQRPQGKKEVMEALYSICPDTFGVFNNAGKLPIHIALATSDIFDVPVIVLENYYSAADNTLGDMAANIICKRCVKKERSQAWVSETNPYFEEELEYLHDVIKGLGSKIREHLLAVRNMSQGDDMTRAIWLRAESHISRHMAFGACNNYGDYCAKLIAQLNDNDFVGAEDNGTLWRYQTLKYLKSKNGLAPLIEEIEEDITLIHNYQGLIEGYDLIPFGIKQQVLRLITDDSFKQVNHTVNFEADRSQPLKGLLDLLLEPLRLTNYSGLPVYKHHVGIKARFQNELGFGVGVTREWLQLVASELTHPRTGLFVPSEDKTTLLFNRFAKEDNGADCMKWYHVFGYIVGLALYYGIPLDFPCNRVLVKCFGMNFFGDSDCEHLCNKFLNQWALDWHDVRLIDESAYRNKLLYIMNEDNDIDSLEETFVMDVLHIRPESTKVVQVELCCNGSKTKLTRKNAYKYCELYRNERITGGCEKQMESFSDGLRRVIHENAANYLTPDDVLKCIAGEPLITVKSWRSWTTYADHLNAQHPTVEMFWDVVEEFNQQTRQKLLHFCTGLKRLPHEGFTSLRGYDNEPNHFQIGASLCTDNAALPFAQTCFNLLRLPDYPDKQTLKSKLLQAMAQEGFNVE